MVMVTVLVVLVRTVIGGTPRDICRDTARWVMVQMVHMAPDNGPVQEEPGQSPQSSPEPSPRFKQSIKSIYQDIHKTRFY